MRWVCTFIVYSGRWSNLNILSSPKFQIFLQSKLYSSWHRWLQFSKAQRLRCPDRSGHLMMSVTSILPTGKVQFGGQCTCIVQIIVDKVFKSFTHLFMFQFSDQPARHPPPDRDRSHHFKYEGCTRVVRFSIYISRPFNAWYKRILLGKDIPIVPDYTQYYNAICCTFPYQRSSMWYQYQHPLTET